MRKVIKKIVGTLIMIGLFLLWFIPQVIEYGLLVSVIGTAILLLLIFLFFLSIFLIFGD